MIMKKFLSSIAALSIAASASALDMSYTAVPAAGSVSELETITLTFTNCGDLEFVDKDAISLKHDGTPLQITPTYSGNVMSIKLAEKATDAGQYVLDFPEACFSGYSPSYDDFADNTPFSIEYTIGAQEEVNKFEYTVSPQEGEVESLDRVEVTFSYSGWNNIKILDKSAITLTLNGQLVSSKASEPISGKKNRIVVTNTSDDKSVPGEYVITIPAGSFRADVKGYETEESEKNPKDIVLKYTVKGGSDPGTDPGTGGDVTGPWGYLTTPAPGVVKELSEIKVVFPNWESIDVNSGDDITLACGNTPVATKIKKNVENGFTMQLDQPVSAPGKYTLSVAAWALTGYKDLTEDGYGTMEDCGAISIEYTIEGAAPGQIDFTATSDPADMSSLKTLDKVVVTFTNLDSVTVGEDWPAVVVGNVPLTEDKYTATVAENVVTVAISPAIAGPADVQVIFPAGAVSGKKGEQTGSNSEDIVFNYSLIGGVEYDLSLDFSFPTKKNENGEISAEKQISAFYFSADVKGLDAAPGSEPNVTIKQVEGDFERTAHLAKAYGMDQNLSYFVADFGAEPTYNGEYVVTIAKGAFGDQQWLSDPETGHSNPELVLNFTLVDGRDVNVNTVEAMVDPAAGTYDTFDKIATVTLTFDEEMTPVEGAGATLVAEDGSKGYNKSAAFTKVDNGFAVTFPAPEFSVIRENFMFSVLPGQFKNASGQGNAEINIIYTVDKTSGVAVIEILNDKSEVYTLDGRRVSGSNLRPGMYIVDGVKVLVK